MSTRRRRTVDGKKMNVHSVGPAVLALRFRNVSFADIADQIGLGSADVAARLYYDELAERLPEGTDREALRREADAMLRGLLGPVYARATDREDPEQMFAVQRATALVDRLIKLHGLDAPSEVVVHTPTTAEIDSWVRQMVGTATVDVVEANVVGELEEAPRADSAAG